MGSSALFVLLAILGAPLFAIFAAVALTGFHAGGLELANVVLEINRLTDTPLLVSIPLFTFAGFLMSEAGTSRRLVALSRALLGWMPGGLALVTLVVSALFTAFTGATGVTIIALGGLLYPALLEDGYPERFSLGLVTTAGSLGLLFPPAVPLILYGVITKVPIDKLFAAGFLPGLLMLALLGAYGVRVAVKSKVPLHRFEWGALGRAVRAAAWELPLPVIVLGGIYSGRFAVSEAAAVTALYALIVEVGIYREVSLAGLFAVMRKSSALVGGILIILAVSLATTNLMIDAQVPTTLFDMINGHVANKYVFLALLNVFLLILGCLLDIFSATVLVVPLILPVAAGYGINPLHLGIIFLANMQIGYCTPPVGMNLFIASYRFNKPVLEITRSVLPFLALLLAVVLLTTYWPDLSLLLTR